MKQGTHSSESTKERKKLQRKKKRYMELREELQVAGEIFVEPEGAVRDERSPSVDPLEDLPLLVRQAIKENWATPDSAKPSILASLLRPFFNKVDVFDKNGEIHSIYESPKTLNDLARTILALDQTQYERDNPEDAGKAKGGVSVQNNNMIAAATAVREAIERGELGKIEVPDIACSSGNGPQQGQLEASGPSGNDQQHSGGCVEDSE